MIRVTSRHRKMMGYCNKGSRIVWEREGWSWPEHLKEGTPLEWVEKAGEHDYMLKKLADLVREVESGQEQ